VILDFGLVRISMRAMWNSSLRQTVLYGIDSAILESASRFLEARLSPTLSVQNEGTHSAEYDERSVKWRYRGTNWMC